MNIESLAEESLHMIFVLNVKTIMLHVKEICLSFGNNATLRQSIAVEELTFPMLKLDQKEHVKNTNLSHLSASSRSTLVY